MSRALAPDAPCPRCSSVERWSNGLCAICERDRMRRYRATPPSHRPAAMKKYRAEHAEKLREYGRRWRSAHPEYQRERKARLAALAEPTPGV